MNGREICPGVWHFEEDYRVYCTLLQGRDRAILVFLACAGAYLLLMALHGALRWRYYPSPGWAGLNAWSLSAFLVWGAVCALPLYLNWKEAREWRSISSRS